MQETARPAPHHDYDLSWRNVDQTNSQELGCLLTTSNGFLGSNLLQLRADCHYVETRRHKKNFPATNAISQIIDFSSGFMASPERKFGGMLKAKGN